MSEHVLSFVPTAAIPCPTVSTVQGFLVFTFDTGWTSGMPSALLIFLIMIFFSGTTELSMHWMKNEDIFTEKITEVSSGHPKSKLSASDCVCKEWKIERELVELWSVPRSLVATLLVRSKFFTLLGVHFHLCFDCL